MTRRVVVPLACLLIAGGVWATAVATTQDSNRVLPVSAERCGQCHEGKHKTWLSGRHSKMLRPATPATVTGDFDRASAVLRGTRFVLVRTGDGFTIAQASRTAANVAPP